MPASQPLISIITINYNQLSVTCEMLDSIRLLTYPNIEVIIVDNGSKENPESHLNQHYPEFQCIRSDENLGFSGGNNIGIEASKGDFLYFVNNDTEIPDGGIEKILALFDRIPKLGVVSPMLCYYPRPEGATTDIIQFVGATEVNPYTARNVILGEKEPQNNQYTEAKPTPYAHGAAMMMPREVIEKVGMWPMNFFLYYEELDWCEQIRRAGYEIYVEPNAMVYHKESISIGKLNPFKTYYLTRNRILFMRRNRSFFQVFVFTLFLIFFTIPKNIIMYIVRGEWDHLSAFVRGIWWNLSSKDKHPKNDYVPAQTV